MFKEYFTGGPKVAKARETVKLIRGKTSPSPRDNRDLHRAHAVTRRHFLKLLRDGAIVTTLLGGTAALVTIGSGGSESETSHQTPSANEFVFNENTLNGLVDEAIVERKRVLGLAQTPRPNIFLVSTVDEVIERTGSAVYPNSGAVTSSQKDGHDRDIYYIKGILDKPFIASTTNISRLTPELRPIYLDLVSTTSDHELTHAESAPYQSALITETLFGKILKDNPQFTGKDIPPAKIKGAAIRVSVEGKQIDIIENLEEAEAYVIGRYVSQNRRKPLKQQVYEVTTIPQDILGQYNLLESLLNRMGQTRAENIKLLAQLRTEIGGREKFCDVLGQRFGVDQENRLYFGLSVLWAIEVKNQAVFDLLTSK